MGHPDHVLFPFLGNSNECVPKIKHSPSNTKPPPVPNNGNSTVAPQQRHMARNSSFLSPSTYGVPGHSSIGAHKLQVCRVFAVEPPFHQPTNDYNNIMGQTASVSQSCGVREPLRNSLAQVGHGATVEGSLFQRGAYSYRLSAGVGLLR